MRPGAHALGRFSLEKRMEQTCPTVKVVAENEQGFVIINESDFDAQKHELHGQEQAKAPATKKGIAELREALTAAGVEFAEDAKKADLQAMFDALPA